MTAKEHPSTPTTEASSEVESTRPKRSTRGWSTRSLFRRSSVQALRSSALVPQVSRFQDHFSLQAPTSFVRFHDSKSAARVIYNQSSQLVIEENYNKEAKKRVITIKQMSEEAGGSLKCLRLTYCLMGTFFLGFLFVFTMQTLYFVALDLSINMGLGENQPDLFFAIGILLSFPVFVHGFALTMMLAGIFLRDIWRGHPLFRKFVFPNKNDEAVEWMFVLGLLILPLVVMGGCLLVGTEEWWTYSALYWFFSILVAYLTFVVSVLWYEARVFFEVVVGLEWIQDFESFFAKVKACILLRQTNLLSGYVHTDYMSFGTPDTAELTGESRKFVIDGTLHENKRGIYSRFSQWSLLQGILYNTLDAPQRLYSVDDITGRRPYVTAYSWGLEKYFCRPRKTRYIGIVKGPGAITRNQLRSSVVCAAVGHLLMYYLFISVLSYFGFGWGMIAIIVIVVAVVTTPFVMGPYRRYRELVRLKAIKKEHKLRMSRMEPPSHDDFNALDAIPEGSANEGNSERELSPVDVEAHVRSDDQEELSLATEEVEQEWKGKINRPSHADDKVSVTFSESTKANDKPSVTFSESSAANTSGERNTLNLYAASDDGVEWMGFPGDDNSGASMGVYAVSERYRITEPTDGFALFHVFLLLVFFAVWPTAALYYIESWQLGTVYLAIALVVMLRHQTNAEVLIQEKGGVLTPGGDADDDESRWQNQSRLSQVAGTISQGKSYHIWRFVYIVTTVILIAFSIRAIGSNPESNDENAMTFTNDFYYETQNSLHYTSCDVSRNLNGNIAASMSDYMFLAAQTYRVPSETENDLNAWFGEGVVIDNPGLVASFRASEKDDIPVSYRLYTAEREGQTYAVVGVRGTQSAWDIFADGQLWGAAALLQMVRALLPFGWIFTPILDDIVVILGTLQTGSIKRLSFYRSTTAFVNYLVDSGNYTSVAILGHSLGGGLAIITGAQAGVQAVGISGPNAMISRHRFDVTAENLERYTFNIIPDRDVIGMIDDPTKNLQRIECRAAQTNSFACHSVRRSLCETHFSCGSGANPAICECSTVFGYPPPLPKPGTNVSFEEVCGATRVVK